MVAGRGRGPAGGEPTVPVRGLDAERGGVPAAGPDAFGVDRVRAQSLPVSRMWRTVFEER